LEVLKRQAVPREGAQSPFDHPGLVRQLYSDDVLDGDFNTEVIEVNNTTAIVARVENYNEPKQRSLSEVADEIRQTLRSQRVREALAERAQELVERLREGVSRDELAEQLEVQWKNHEEVTRRGADVPFDVLNAVFRMPRPEGSDASYSAVSGAQRAVMVALKSVSEGSVEDGEQQRQALQQFLSSQRGQREYLAYRESLLSDADVERP
jgi:peptidyl-prolyl cis-trans isomerase D